MEHHRRHRLNPYRPVPDAPPAVAAPQDPDGSGGGVDQRLPQWSHEETRELLSVRAQLDKSFSETKRNKPLWEATSSLLLLKGFSRTPDQCKSKWKNLVTRFKGSESLMEGEKQQFPFYEEMRRIFSDRAATTPSEKGKRPVQVKESEGEELEEEESGKVGKKKRKLNHQVAAGRKSMAISTAMREFMRRLMETEARWLEAAESRESARQAEEEEWRRLMQALRAERAEMERRWRASEEERRAREEARAERRHQLIMALLDKLIAQKD
ncbi:trihelix transcription factor GT-3a-like [Curcuma longa]|uniref:trihelix transcription factor GT-3a-like n=1 Tax=Curcuma longa TaxID=136217 RepID=UPI003D9FA519